MRSFKYGLGVLVALAVGAFTPAHAPAQEMAMGDRAPRFLLSAPKGPVPVDVYRTAVLRRRISLELRDVTLDEALKTIARQSGLRLGYSRNVVPLDRVVRLVAEDITVAGALSEVLFDTGVDVLFQRDGQAALVRRGAVAGRGDQGVVVGKVTDVKTGLALMGAEVFLEGTRWRASTGEDGRYRLVAVTPGSYTITARRVGYGKQSQVVVIAGGTELTVDIALPPVATQLDEIVTTVTGEQRVRELGHVVGRINADSLVKEAPVASVTELLTARVPGLLVQPLQGTVGGEVKLQIRSATSIALSTEPIVIVDGIRYTTDPRAGPTAKDRAAINFFATEATSRLNDLNPNDVESVEVVKGPSAATLYGTDAANGVIVITTKRGRPGPARWSAYARTSMTEIPQYHYPDSWWGWRTVGGVPSLTSNCTLRLVANGTCVQDSITVLPNPLNDPSLTIFGGKPRWEYGANLAGGREDLRYYFSGDFEDATGPIRMPPGVLDNIKARRGVSELPEEQLKPNASTKLNLRSTASAGLGKRAELRVSAGYTQSATRALARGTPYEGSTAGTPSMPYGGSQSPQDAFSLTSTERINRFFGSAAGEWRPWNWLQGRVTVGLDLTSSARYSLARPGEAPNSGASQGVVDDQRTRYLVSSADMGITGSFRHGRFSSRTSVGAQYVRTLFDALTGRGIGLPPGGSTVGQASSITSFQNFYERITLGSYLEQVVGVNDRIFLTGAIRMDGATTFGQDYDVAVYPKAGVSWLLSEEPFLDRVPGLDELRLRYAFGASGQQPWPEWERARFIASQRFVDGRVGNAVRVMSIGNPDLRPELVREHEFGLDATLLQGRAQLGLTWTRRRTLDQLVSQDLPPGFGAIMTNIGRIDGHGFEAEFTVRPVETRAVSWAVTMHHAWHTGTVVDLGGGLANRRTDGGYAEGYPIGARFSYPLLGYSDANGNGIIERTEVRLGDSLVYVGRGEPPRTQTLNTTLGLFRRHVRVSALLDRQSGFVQRNVQLLSQCNPFTSSAGRCRAAVDPATPLADQAMVMAVEAAAGATRYSPVEPGDFTRLRELTVALDLPEGFVRAVRMRSASFSVSARNLAMWTGYAGADPESWDTGSNSFRIPQSRAWVFRLDVGF